MEPEEPGIMNNYNRRPSCRICGDPVMDCGDYWSNLCERHDDAVTRINGSEASLVLGE